MKPLLLFLLATSYRVETSFPIPGDGTFDYLTIDSSARRLYLSHQTQVEVLNADSGTIIGKIAPTNGVHGIALAPEFNRGFTSNGKANTVTIFELSSLKPIATVETGRKPDFILYEPISKRVFAFDGDDNDATAIGAANGEALGKVKLGGAPEAAVSDGNGGIYVNLEDKNAVVSFDARALTMKKTWPLAPCEAPSSMAIDRRNSRLFIGCRNKLMAVVDASTGTVVGTMPIGDHVDAAAFDEKTRTIFESCGDGTLAVIHQESPDKYTQVQTVRTEPGAKTLAFDPTTRKLFLPVAKREGRNIVPGTFHVIVVAPK